MRVDGIAPGETFYKLTLKDVNIFGVPHDFEIKVHPEELESIRDFLNGSEYLELNDKYSNSKYIFRYIADGYQKFIYFNILDKSEPDLTELFVYFKNTDSQFVKSKQLYSTYIDANVFIESLAFYFDKLISDDASEDKEELDELIDMFTDSARINERSGKRVSKKNHIKLKVWKPPKR